MIEDEANHGAWGLPTRIIQPFPEHFQADYKTNLVHVACWWALHETHFNTHDDSFYHAQSRDPKDDKFLTQKITYC